MLSQFITIDKNEYKATGTYNLQEAVNLLKSGIKFDIIITDLQLPDASRNEVIPTIKNLCDDSPIVVLSGYTDDRIMRECLLDGAFYVLNKGQVLNTDITTVIQAILKLKSLV